MRHPPIPAPLLWYCWLAAWLLGSLAALWLWQAAFCLGLVMVFAIASRPVSLPNAIIRLGLGLAIFALALTIARAELEPPATIPEDPVRASDSGVRAGLHPGQDQSGHDLARQKLIEQNLARQEQTGKRPTGKRSRPAICATVSQVQSLPDQRLRVLLESPKLYGHLEKTVARLPEESADRTEIQPLAGLVAWTWDHPSFYPLPGQAICIRKSPKPLSGFANFDLPEWNTGLRLQGARWRLWSRGEDGGPALAGAGTDTLARLRQSLVRRVASLAGLPVIPEFAPGSGPGNSGQSVKAAPETSGGDNSKNPARLPVAHPDGQSPVCSPELTYQQNQARAFLPALLFGERFWLSSQTVDKFAAASLAHSLALSGQHLAIAWLAAACIVAILVRSWTNLYLAMPRSIIIVLLACPLAGIYLWLGNAPWSLLRAGAMLAVLAACICLRRGHSLADILAIALLCLSIARPTAILETGLQLSMFCVSVIAVCLSWLRRMRNWLQAGPGSPWYHRMAFACLSILGISLAIQIFLLPMNILLFGNPGFAFALNLVWLPVLGLWLLPLAFVGLLLACPGLFLATFWPGAAVCCDAASSFCLQLARLPAELLLWLLDWLEGAGLLSVPACMRPHWTALPAFALLLLTLACLAACQLRGHQAWIQLRDRVRTARWILALAIILLAIGPLCRLRDRLNDDLRLEMLDVGLGQALVLRSPGGQRLVIDAGGSASPRFDPGKAIVAPAILAGHGPELTAIINSHPDMDHAGGIFYLREHFRTGPLLHNGRQAEGKRAKDWARLLDSPEATSLAAGDRIRLDHDPADGDGNCVDRDQAGRKTQLAGSEELVLEVLHPPLDAQAGQWSDNGASLVLRMVRMGKGLALLTGDADQATLRYLLAQKREHGLDLTAEVLIAPHHGSDKNFLPEFYQAVRPSLVIASCGASNRYNYPGKRLTTWLSQHNIPLLDTGKNGQIRIRWRKDGRMTSEWARQR